jgi:hypothetical protein
VKTLEDKELIQTLEQAEKIGCNESFLFLLLKLVEQRKLQVKRDTVSSNGKILNNSI